MNAIVARAKRDDGFTLLELLMATVILGIIIAAVATALVVGLTTTDDTSRRFSESHDAQIASAWLARDVQGSLTITSSTCGAPGSLTDLINFNYDTASPPKQITSYYYGTSNGESQLTRRSCDASGTQMSNLVLAHFAGSVKPSTCLVGTSWSNCSDLLLQNKPKPDEVKIEVTEQSSGADVIPYSFTLLGARRTWSNAGGGTPPTPATVNFLALGGSSGQLEIKGGGGDSGSTLIVHGSLWVNSNAPGAVTLPPQNCSPCLKIMNNGSLKIYGLTLQGGSYVQCTHCSSTSVNPGWPPGPLNSSIPDPLRLMPVPGQPGAPPCDYVYTGLFSPPPGNNVLPPGIYCLQNGMSINAGAIVSGSGVVLFNTCPPGGCGGSAGGPITVNGQGGLTLTPPTSGPYAGVVIFQDEKNPKSMTFNGGSVTSSLEGTIYVRCPTDSSTGLPNCGNNPTVSLGAGNNGLTVYSVIAPNVKIAGGGTVTVGP